MIKVGCQSGKKVVTHNSKSDLPLDSHKITWFVKKIETYDEDIPGWIGLIFNFNPGGGPGCCCWVVWWWSLSFSFSLCLCLCFLLELDEDRWWSDPVSPLLDLCRWSLLSRSFLSFFCFFSFLCFLWEFDEDEEDGAGCWCWWPWCCCMTSVVCVEVGNKGMLTTMDLVGCCGCCWCCTVWSGSVLGSFMVERPSRNFSKPVISSTFANFKEATEPAGLISLPDVVLSLLDDVCVVLASSMSGSKISPMSSFSTAKRTTKRFDEKHFLENFSHC